MPTSVFFADEGHTLASMIRATLRSSSDTSIVSCVVNDDLVDPSGVVVRAECVADIVDAIDANLDWLQGLRTQLGLRPSSL
jgi:DNA-directed RNA polymerase subunit L